MTEYGIFNDEGLVEGGFYDYAKADLRAAEERAAGDEWAFAEAICGSHEFERMDSCEECSADDREEDERNENPEAYSDTADFEVSA